MSIEIHKNDGFKLGKTYICLTDDSYLITNDNNIIGFFNVIKFNDSVMLDYELIEKYRGKGLGKKLFKIVEEYVYNNFEFNRFIAFIKENNKIAEKLVDGYNYKKDFDFNNEEMLNFNTYYKTNEKNKKKILN